MRVSRRGREEPIEDYLDELLSCLRLPPRATRRLLAETEDHLREAASVAEQAGRSRLDAEREAIARFGPATRIASDASRARRPSAVAVSGAAAWAALALGGVGLTAVGVSGALAAVFNGVVGTRFVGALPQTYSPAVCGHFLSLHTGAGSCGLAAILENSHDAVALRLLAGLVGLVSVGLAWWTRRYLSTDPSFRRLLDGSTCLLAAVAFAAATAVLLGMSVDTAVQHGSGGVGWYLSGGLVSLVAAVAAGACTWRQVRTLRPWNHVLAEPGN